MNPPLMRTSYKFQCGKWPSVLLSFSRERDQNLSRTTSWQEKVCISVFPQLGLSVVPQRLNITDLNRNITIFSFWLRGFKPLCASAGRLSVDSSEGDVEVSCAVFVFSWTGAIVCVRFCVCDGPTHPAPSSSLPPSLLLTRALRVPTPPPHPPSGPFYTDARAPTHKPCLNRWDGHVHFQTHVDAYGLKLHLLLTSVTQRNSDISSVLLFYRSYCMWIQHKPIFNNSLHKTYGVEM